MGEGRQGIGREGRVKPARRNDAALAEHERGERYRDHAVPGHPFVYRELPGAHIRRLQQAVALALTRQFDARGSDLTPVQYTVLAAVCTHPMIEQGELADVVGYDRATVGGVIDRLEKKALVKRNLSPSDRRVRLLAISPAGTALLKRLAPAILEAQDVVLAPLDERERAELARLLGKLVAANQRA
jgi:DNA-binding MarR family transcriptional regulator